MNLNFESGKIKDFNKNYIGSYFPNKQINFSGDIFSGGHVYYMNNNVVSLSGTQDYFKFKRFFYNSNGFNIDSQLKIYTEKQKKSYIAEFFMKVCKDLIDILDIMKRGASKKL